MDDLVVNSAFFRPRTFTLDPPDAARYRHNTVVEFVVPPERLLNITKGSLNVNLAVEAKKTDEKTNVYTSSRLIPSSQPERFS